MTFIGRFIVVLALLPVTALAEPPEWFLESLQQLAPDTSVWVADNAMYRTANEQIDEYVLEWRWGLGRKSAVGRLYGVVDGEDVGTFWEFRTFWHPEKKAAYVQQFGGDGTFGTGQLKIDSENENIQRLTQTFFSPDGGTMQLGHKTTHAVDSNTGTSYDILADGSWQERRTYSWHRKSKAEE